MKGFNTQLFVVIIGIVCVCSIPAMGGDKYFTGESSNAWNVNGNWRTNSDCTGAFGKPTSTDVAHIGVDDCPDKTVQITEIGVEVQAIDIKSGSKIEVIPTTADAALKLGAAGTSTIDGELILKVGDGTTRATLRIKHVAHTIDGIGTIKGQDDLARIRVHGSSASLTSKVTIEGNLRIVGNGDFTNKGEVHANTSGTLLIAMDDLDDDAGTGAPGDPRWSCTDANATLKFVNSIGSIASMEGDFYVTAGVVLFELDNVAAVTSGRLYQTGGTMDIGRTFTMGTTGQDARTLHMTGGKIIARAGHKFTHLGLGGGRSDSCVDCPPN